MMESFHRYRALGAADRWLVIEAASLLAIVRLGIAALRFSVLRRSLDHMLPAIPAKSSGKRTSSVDRLAWSVAAASRRLPFRSNCLIESLAVDAMMRRRGHASEIRFGVRPPNAGVLTAHAWVECEGAIVFGSLQDYSALSTGHASHVYD